jgi:hypothetical protein
LIELRNRNHQADHSANVSDPAALQGKDPSHAVNGKGTERVADNGDVRPATSKYELHDCPVSEGPIQYWIVPGCMCQILSRAMPRTSQNQALRSAMALLDEHWRVEKLTLCPLASEILITAGETTHLRPTR